MHVPENLLGPTHDPSVLWTDIVDIDLMKSWFWRAIG